MTSTRHFANRMFFFLLCLLGVVNYGWAAQKGGTLIYAQTANFETFDPPVVNDNNSEEVNSMVYDNLLRLTPELKIKGQLAEKWETSQDGMAWTFWIRKGVKFHDGTELDAEAVKSNFDRWLGPEKPFKSNSLFAPVVKSVEVVDKYRMRLHLKAPFSSLPAYLAHPAAAIGSPTHFKKHGVNVAANPSGSGPFQFKEWVKGDHVTLVRNENYWDGAPYLDGIIIKPVSEESTRVMQLQAGQIHVATQIPPEVLPQLKKDPKLSLYITPTNIGLYVTINNTKKPFNDIRVRQAMNYAVDKEAVIRDLYQGMADPMSSVNAPILLGAYQPRPYEYNPARAKKLLAEAGYPNGFSCSQWVVAGRYAKYDELSQLIQNYLGVVGIKTELKTIELAAYEIESRQPPEKAKYDMFLAKWAPSTGEARWQLYAAWTRERWPLAGANRALYSNPVFDRLVELATKAPNDELRDQYLRGAQTILAEDAPCVPICALKTVNAASKKVHDFIFSPLYFYATNKTWMEK